MKKRIFVLLLLTPLFLFSQKKASLLLDNTDTTTTISRHIYGQFSEHLGRCIYDGFWVAPSMNVRKQDRIRLDVVEALKKINIPNLRWPGGCFADEYHWRDGIGKRSTRPKMINTHWGGVTEDNSFGTHEFLELCQLLNTEPYISANVGSGTVEEMSQWVEYLNFGGVSPMSELRKENGKTSPWKVRFWGVGNESWGCGGNMTPEYYANEYRRYATYARNYPDADLKKIASGANNDDYNWTEVCMKNIPHHLMWGLSLHYYTIPTGQWNHKGSATDFNEKEYFETMKRCLKIEELVSKHEDVMDKYDPQRRVALVVDEWGIWTDVEPGTNPGFLYQQNSMRDAIIAASSLNVFNNHSKRVRMANLAQTVNVLQALILTKDSQMLLTPTYHIFDMYKDHMDAKLIPLKIVSPEYIMENQIIKAVNGSASIDSTGKVCITLVNIDPHDDIEIHTTFAENKNLKFIKGSILTSANFNDVNTFENKNKITTQSFDNVKKNGDNFKILLPRLSVVNISFM